MPVTVRDVRAFKDRGEKFSMLTAYDAPSARLLDEAGIPLLLVGDTLGMVMLGHETTLPVTMEDMLHHTAAVVRGRKNALVVGDMPFMSYQGSVEDGIRNAGRFLKEAGAHAVKLEGGGRVLDLVARLTDSGIPVMGHLGLTPQSVNQFGGYRVQGRSEEQAHRIVAEAKDLEAAGAFALVLEAVPSQVAASVTAGGAERAGGGGAGPEGGGQVRVGPGFRGLTGGRGPRGGGGCAKLGEERRWGAVACPQVKVSSGVYPAPEHTYG